MKVALRDDIAWVFLMIHCTAEHTLVNHILPVAVETIIAKVATRQKKR